jgi:Flp pilus assembly protein TadB
MVRIYLALTKLVASLRMVVEYPRGKSMTSLEQALASILDLIEKAKAAGNSLALATLIARKHAICAALAAPEQH